MNFSETALAGVIEATPVRHGDDRGWFSEVWKQSAWADAGIAIDWVQDNESLSAQTGTLRGIHFQREPFAQDKLVRVISGQIYDVAVDLRKSSPTFMQWVGVELSSEAGNQLLVPAGFGHGFVTLVPDCHVAYKVSAPYSPEHDAGVAWNDPDLAIDWPVDHETAVVSAKDAVAPTLADAADLLFA